MANNEINVAKEIMIKLVNNEINFSLALKNTFNKHNLDGTQKSNISALLGCELRHHYIFDNLIARFIGEVEFEKTINLRFALANYLFLKRFNQESLLALAKEDLDSSKVDSLFDFVIHTNAIIPEELDKTSPEFLSLRYNTPAWVIRMWQKQYGKGVVFKILKVNYRQSNYSLRVSDSLDIDKFIATHPDFVKASVDKMVIYQGRGTPKGLIEFKNNQIFFMKLATKDVLDKLDLDPLKGIAIFSEVPNNMHFELFDRFKDNLHLDLVINHSNFYYEVRKYVKEKAFDHVYVYEASESSLITCLSKRVHTFICLPKNTMFDYFRSAPDYFLRVKQDELDAIIAHEYSSLEESSKFVELDGELIYMIPSLNRKESNSLIAKFLLEHQDFALIEEKQYFPFDSYDSCLYFARLKKVVNTGD